MSLDFERNFSVVIPTMQKNTQILGMLISELLLSEKVQEIIVIDNKSVGYTYEVPSVYKTELEKNNLINFSKRKLKVIIPTENLFVNPSWNYGVRISTYDNIAILNDDMLLPLNVFDIVAQYLDENPTVGVIGVKEDCVIQTKPERFLEYPVSDDISIKELNQIFNLKYFGIAMFGKKENFPMIPENLRIYCGDNFYLRNSVDKGLKVCQLSNLEVWHVSSMTSGCKEMKQYLIDDVCAYAELDPEFKRNYRKRTFAENIFSIRKSLDKRYKEITILGVTFKKKRKLM